MHKCACDLSETYIDIMRHLQSSNTAQSALWAVHNRNAKIEICSAVCLVSDLSHRKLLMMVFWPWMKQTSR